MQPDATGASGGGKVGENAATAEMKPLDAGRETRTNITPKDIWDKLDVLSRIMSAIAIPAVIAIGGWYIQDFTTRQSISKDYVTLAISILEKPKSKEDSGLRDWAVDLLDHNAPIKLPAATVARLRSGSLILSGISLRLRLTPFRTERDAQAHCPSDTVVWLNTNSGIYHEKGTRWYGNTRSGGYMCRRTADASGDRADSNGQ
jgi:hypothetical protein